MSAESFSLAALICLGLGSAAALAGFWHERFRNNSSQFIAVGLGIFFKTLAIGAACSKNGQHFFSSASEMAGLLGWALGISYLLALAVSAARSLGAVILPLVTVLMALSHILNKESVDPGVPADQLLAVHIVSAFLGYGLFLTACGASVLYLGQSVLLKRKTFGAIFKDMPSLDRLERLEILCSWLGLVAFSIAIAAGAVIASRLNRPFWTEPKVLATQITWLIFGVLVIGRAARWLNGRVAAKVVLAGAALVLVTFALSHPLFSRAASMNEPSGAIDAVAQTQRLESRRP